ncbi:MAG: hypothetical protein CL816_04795 [Coxiellaceae bacterium]|nr:hypothetical protein [Coxiellaceae bacterium]
MLFECCTTDKKKGQTVTEPTETITAQNIADNNLAREVLTQVITKMIGLEPQAASDLNGVFRGFISGAKKRYAQYHDQWSTCYDNIQLIQDSLITKHTPSSITQETETIYKKLGDAIITYKNSIDAIDPRSTNVKPRLVESLHINNGAVDIEALKKVCQEKINQTDCHCC